MNNINTNNKSPEIKNQDLFFADEIGLVTKSWLQNLKLRRVPKIFVSAHRIGQISIENYDYKSEEIKLRERFKKAETNCTKYFFDKESQKLELVIFPLAKLPWLKQRSVASHRNFSISLKRHEKRKLISEWFKVEFQQVYFPKEIINLFKLKEQEQRDFLTGTEDLAQILTNRNLTK
jgi:hypothetical protein